MEYSIVPIVEGFGEVESIPVLMRRLLGKWNKYSITVAKPVRAPRYQVVKEGELERRIELAKTRPNCSAIILILDSNDDCPKEFAPVLFQRAKEYASPVLASVVLAKFELESWFLGSIESLRGKRGISLTACSPENPEDIRDAKGELSNLMANHYYSEIDDQPAFADIFDFEQALKKCRSFKKFYSDFYRITCTLLP